jgi:hypothetical protein
VNRDSLPGQAGGTLLAIYRGVTTLTELPEHVRDAYTTAVDVTRLLADAGCPQLALSALRRSLAEAKEAQADGLPWATPLVRLYTRELQAFRMIGG